MGEVRCSLETEVVMRFARELSAIIWVCVLASSPCVASRLVTGNGFGFAVVSPETATVTKFYAHPYSFVRPDPKNAVGEGIETTNFIKSLGWGDGAVEGASADYVEDSHVIRARSSAGEGLVFMPFGFNHAALILDWKPAKAMRDAHVEWSHAVRSSQTVRTPGSEMQVLTFEGVPERLLLIPLEPQKGITAGAREVLMGSASWALVSLENDDQVDEVARAFSAWRGGLPSNELVKREMAETERWRVKPPCILRVKRNGIFGVRAKSCCAWRRAASPTVPDATATA